MRSDEEDGVSTRVPAWQSVRRADKEESAYQFPVGKINKTASSKNHLGIVIHSCIQHVQRPFLEKWHADVRHWWDFESDKQLPPFQRQARFPRLPEMQKDWANPRYRMRQLQDELVATNALINVHSKN